MASRPKSVLWVDDEIESLESHRRFLTDHGYAVAAAAHGDDALEMLRRQAYGVVSCSARSASWIRRCRWGW